MAENLERWLKVRQRARTDLIWLCQEILDYPDVSGRVHGQLSASLQKFKGGKETFTPKTVRGNPNGVSMKELIEGYEPFVDMWDLTGARERLILVARNHLKTTVATIAHTIQWIINYPNVRILLSSGTGGQVAGFLRAIKEHFQTNETFRYYFPEFVPQKNVREFGNQEQFTVPCRTAITPESTVATTSVGSVVAGAHYDIIKHDDMVDKENVRTPEQIQNVKNHYGFLDPLLQRVSKPPYRGWTDVIGTRYDYCLVGRTRITMADWSQRPISNVIVGDTVVGWIKEKGKRYLRQSKVVACGKYEKRQVNRYTFQSGGSVVCTPEHRWWKGPWSSGDDYKSLGLHYHKMRHVRRLLVPSEQDSSRTAGWLAGMYDGEGTIQVNRAPYTSATITISQSMHNPNLVERIRESLRTLSFNFTESWHSPSKVKGGQAHWKDRCIFKINGGWKERYRFLLQIAPFRYERIAASLFSQLMTEEDSLVSMQDAGQEDVYWFQSETGNYIAEGYCSKNSDLYGALLDAHEKAKEKGESAWRVLVQSAVVEGELSDAPCPKSDCEIKEKHKILDHCETLWPERFPASELMRIAEDPTRGWQHLYSQYLMDPRPDSSGLVDSDDQIVWMPLEAAKKLYAYLSLHVTVDLAGMEPATNKLADNDYTVINLHGFAHDGTLIILSILRGRYTPFEVIDMLFKLNAVHPRIVDIKVEKEAHARVLLPFLKREMSKRGKWLPIVEIRRDNRTSKQQRIKGLQPWFRNGSIKFQDGQPHKLAILNEIMRFPKFAHDDILDTIADAMQNREGGVTSDVMPMPKQQADYPDRPVPPELMSAIKLWGEDKSEEANVVDLVTGW